jgi:hypothetical protein
MANPEESLRFYNWAQLQKTPSDSPPPIPPLIGAGYASTVSSGRSPPAQPPAAPAGSAHSEVPKSAGIPSVYLLPTFNVAELLAKPPILSPECLDPETVHILGRILAEIKEGFCPESSRVDRLVVRRRDQFACPFLRCLKKHGGWECIRNVRDHIWIDHFLRRIPCTWDNWYVFTSTDRFWA